MTKQEFAKKIKEKYPDYNNIDDNVLADKMLEKYPVYKSQITNQSFVENVKSDFQKRGTALASSIKAGQSLGSNILQFGGAVAGGITDTIGEGIKAIAPQPVKDAAKMTGAALLQSSLGQSFLAAAKVGVGAYNDIKKQHPEAAKNFEAVVNIASLLPVGKGTKLVAKGTKKTVATGADIAKSGAKIALKSAEPVGKAIEKTGEFIGKSAIPLSKPEAKSVQAFKAAKGTEKQFPEPITAGKTAFEKGFMGTESMIGVQAKKTADTIWNDTVKPALSKIKTTIKTPNIFKSVGEKIIKNIKEPIRQEKMLADLKAMAGAYKNFPEMSHQFAQDIKSDLYKFLPDKIFNGKPVAAVSTEVKAMFAHELRNATREALKNNKAALKAFDEYGNLKSLMEFGQNAMTSAKKKGGFGSFMTSAYENATVPLKTAGGQVLKKIGQALQIKK